MKIQNYHFPSATAVCEINASTYLPDNDEVKAVMVIHHGMAEHRDRYLGFIEYLTSKGIAVYMYDMANHGKSNQDRELTGFFGNKDGYRNLVKDLKTLFDMAKKAFPDKKIVVMGHSMGSFVVRCFTAWYNDAGFDGAVYMGTGGDMPILALGDKLSGAVAKMTGYTRKSKLLDKMAFGTYGEKFEKRTAFDWLTRDSEIVDKYISDEYCGFLFSAQGMNDLIKLNISANKQEWYENIPKDLPILLTSGDMDPVGEYSKGIKRIASRLLESGHTRVETKLYPDSRHEILNELNKDEVYSDIFNWIEEQVL